MNPLLLSGMVQYFRTGLHWSGVHEGERVLIYTDPTFDYPEYPPAALAAAESLGAAAWIMTGPPRRVTFEDRLVMDAWKGSDLVVNMAWPGVWIYSDEHRDVLDAGTRVLAARGKPDAIRRLMPTSKTLDRLDLARQRFEAAEEIRVTSKAGSDFRMSKATRKVHVQAGVANQPGMWDNLGSGMLCTAPLETETRGRYIISPGDVILGRPVSRPVTTPIDLCFEDGAIVKIDGGLDAQTLIADRIPKGTDVSRRAVAHAGWGMHPATEWNNAGGQDAESFYGSVMVSLGSNIFDTPHQNRGFGGSNDAGWHIDICCRNTNLYLDDEPIVVDGAIVPRELQ